MTVLMALVILGLFTFVCSSQAITCYECNTHQQNETCKYPLDVDSVATCNEDHADAFCYKYRTEYPAPGDADIFYFYMHF